MREEEKKIVEFHFSLEHFLKISEGSGEKIIIVTYGLNPQSKNEHSGQILILLAF
jgi:hypothetical protein